ncbi:MAG: hypothetical protein ED557_12860 [Balneola sp.]|nr:MAG: hypothetical protein ED557_12860 [Balneola sp.]
MKQNSTYDIIRVFYLFNRHRTLFISYLLPLLVLQFLVVHFLQEILWTISPFFSLNGIIVGIVNFLFVFALLLLTLLLAEVAFYSLPNDRNEIIDKFKNVFKSFTIVYFGYHALTIMGFFLFIIPGLLVSVYFIFTPVIVVFEKLSIKEAMYLSYTEAKIKFFRILLATLILELPFIIIGYFLDLPDNIFLEMIVHIFSSFSSILLMLLVYIYYLEIKKEDRSNSVDTA